MTKNKTRKTGSIPFCLAWDGQGNNEDDDYSIFHRDVKGEVVFSAHEAERVSNFVASSNLEERVKAALQQKRFVLPQETDTASAHL